MPHAHRRATVLCVRHATQRRRAPPASLRIRSTRSRRRAGTATTSARRSPSASPPARSCSARASSAGISSAREQRDERQPRQVVERADREDDRPRAFSAPSIAPSRTLGEHAGDDADQAGADQIDSRIGSASSATHGDARGDRGDDHVGASRSTGTSEREEAQRHREFERPRRRDHVAAPDSRRRSATCHVDPQQHAARRGNTSAPPRGSSRARKRRIDAANAWSVSRNASTLRQRAGSGFRYGAIAALYIRKRRPTTKQVSTITATGAPRGEQLRGEDLRRAGEDDRATCRARPTADAPAPARRRRRPGRTAAGRAAAAVMSRTPARNLEATSEREVRMRPERRRRGRLRRHCIPAKGAAIPARHRSCRTRIPRRCDTRYDASGGRRAHAVAAAAIASPEKPMDLPVNHRQRARAGSCRSRCPHEPLHVPVASPFRCVLDVAREPRRMPGLVGRRAGALLGRHQRAVAQPLRSGDRPQHARCRCRSRSAASRCAATAASSSRCAAASGSPGRTARSTRKVAAAPYDPAHHRFNDGRCDPQGRFFAGSMNETRDAATGGALCASIPTSRSTRVLSGMTISNGLAWSPDGRTMYHADTPTQTIHAYDYDAATGTPSQPARVRALHGERDRPDGAAVDSDGCYWTAFYRGGKVARIAPDGRVLAEYPVPAMCPTMCAFGGPDLKTLYVTSARQKRERRRARAAAAFRRPLRDGGRRAGPARARVRRLSSRAADRRAMTFDPPRSSAPRRAAEPRHVRVGRRRSRRRPATSSR